MARPDKSSCHQPCRSTALTRSGPDFLAGLKAKPLIELNAALTALTEQERIVLELIVRGHCNKEICNTLDIEITTAKAHTSRIFKKLGVKNRVQAAVFGFWTSLVSGNMHDGKQGPGTHAGTVHSDALQVLPQ